VIGVLQFDSASLSVLERLLGEGRLPALAGLRERGAWHALQTPATHFAAGAFHTLYSGVELPDHGIYYPFQWSADDQRCRYMRALDPPAAVWERLARRGLRTLAVDPYESRPPSYAAGTLVCGWQLTDRVVLQPWSRPKGERRSLERLFGPAPPAEEIFGRPAASELLELRRHLIAAPARVADAAERLLAGREPFVLAWLTFTAAHLAGHQFWDLSQVSPRGLDGDARALLGTALDDVYEAVDAALGRVLAALPEETDVIVTSPVGMDVNTSRADLLPEMLEAVLRGGAAPDRAPGYIWRLRAAVPPGLRGRVARALPDRLTLDLTARLELRGMDWSRTRAFAQPADNQGYVRLNLRGREREGVVAPDEADALCAEIADGLTSFSDPDGSPAVAAVERVRDEFGTGARRHRLPDLVVRWSDRPATRLEGVVSPRFGEVRRRGGASGRAGNHTGGDGWALLVPGAARHRDPGRPRRLVDVAATVAALAGGRRGEPDGASAMAGEPLLEPR
jgi:predicted AlkP superfamily phosphohydrolase/phosphomutase